MPDQPQPEGPVAMPPTGPIIVVRTDQEQAHERNRAKSAARLAADDRARAAAPRVTMIAVTSFTIHDDPSLTEGRVIKRGDEIEISAYDLPTFTGRCRLKAADPAGGAAQA